MALNFSNLSPHYLTPVLLPSDRTPNVTVSTAAALESTMSSWASDWAGSAGTLGIAIFDERIIAIDTSISSNVDMTSLVFPEMVWIVSAASPFSDEECSFKIPGELDATGSTKIGFGMLHCIGVRRLVVNGTTDCVISRCFLQGMTSATPSSMAISTRNYIIQLTGSLVTDLTIEDNRIGWAQYPILVQAANDGLVIRRNCYDWIKSDNHQFGSSGDNLVIQNNWAASNQTDDTSTSAHEDFLQFRGPYDNVLVEGNVGLLDQNRWYAGASGVWQVCFIGNSTSVTNSLYRQNMFGSNTAIVVHGPGTTNTGSVTEYNMGVQVKARTTDGDLAARFTGATLNRNWTMNDGGSDNGAGTDGVTYDVGDYSTPDHTLTDPEFIRSTPVEGSPISEWEPSASATWHWDTVSPVGPYSRAEEIFSTGGYLVPGNVGWPVAAVWEREYNFGSNQIATSYDGTYKDNGDNTNSSVVSPTAPDAFTTGIWSGSDPETGGKLDISISSLPSSNGSDITDIKYQIGAGSLVSTGGIVDFPITGLTDDVQISVTLYAVNSVGDSIQSDAKLLTPTTAPATIPTPRPRLNGGRPFVGSNGLVIFG